MELAPRCVVPAGDQCGEAATWVPEEHALYWTDVNRFLVHRLDVASSQVRTWLFDEPCVALFLTDTPGTLLLALGSRIIRWRPRTDQRDEFAFALDDWPVARLNDGRPGPAGELWIGSMANNVGSDGSPGEVEGERGRLFRLGTGGKCHIARTGIGISNTICFSPDDRHFYFGDTVKNTIWRYRYDSNAEQISEETPFFGGFHRGLPDGSAIDAEGYVWNCRFGGGCIVRIDPEGKIDRVIEMPVSNITTCEFGDKNLTTLYVTTAAMMTSSFERLAGSLFALDAPVPGAPPRRVSLDQATTRN